MSVEEKFCSKILLFGEYGVLYGSMALSVPYFLFGGKLRFAKETPDLELENLARHLSNLSAKGQLGFDFDLHSYKEDVARGLFFDSTIPRGFGVGSSGALCAAVLERYGAVKKMGLELLKNIFSLMESHFHGSSSGLDPLISHLKRSVLVREDRTMDTVKIPNYPVGEGALFLINSGKTRKADSFINLFLERIKDEGFEEFILKTFVPATNQCISSFLDGATDRLYRHFHALSSMQLEHFVPMIPKHIRDIWERGLDSKSYLLKLCGAGGGGFFLGMTENFSKVQQLLPDHELRPLYRFSA